MVCFHTWVVLSLSIGKRKICLGLDFKSLMASGKTVYQITRFSADMFPSPGRSVIEWQAQHYTCNLVRVPARPEFLNSRKARTLTAGTSCVLSSVAIHLLS